MLSLNERKKYIKTYINTFFPNVITNLISEYDYHFNGNSSVVVKQYDKIECLSVFPDGRIISGSKNKLKVFNLQNNSCDNFNNNITLEEHNDKIWCCAILSDEQVVTCSTDYTLKIFNLQTIQKRKCVVTMSDHNVIYCVAVLQDGRIISGSASGTLKIWDKDTGICVIKLKDHTDAVLCVTTTLPNGKIISGSRDKTLKIWNYQTNDCEVTFTGHKHSVICIGILSNHNKYQIVSGSADWTIKIWDPFTSEIKNNIINCCELTLTGHSNYVYCIGILPDGRIISGSCDKTIKIWNLQDQSLTDKCEMTLHGHTETVSCINILQDGRVVSGSYDGTIIIWN